MERCVCGSPATHADCLNAEWELIHELIGDPIPAGADPIWQPCDMIFDWPVRPTTSLSVSITEIDRWLDPAGIYPFG